MSDCLYLMFGPRCASHGTLPDGSPAAATQSLRPPGETPRRQSHGISAPINTLQTCSAVCRPSFVHTSPPPCLCQPWLWRWGSKQCQKQQTMRLAQAQWWMLRLKAWTPSCQPQSLLAHLHQANDISCIEWHVTGVVRDFEVANTMWQRQALCLVLERAVSGGSGCKYQDESITQLGAVCSATGDSNPARLRRSTAQHSDFSVSESNLG